MEGRSPEEHKFTLYLPSLVEDGLIEDDSIHYALLTFDQDVISDSVKIAMKSLSGDPKDLIINTKKRVKYLMDMFGVSLTLPILDTPIMAKAQAAYSEWLKDSSFFGDIKRQNKYIRRIIKQFSSPFQFRNAVSTNDFTDRFYPMIKNIIESLKQLMIERGHELEYETKITLMNVTLGITNAIMNFTFTNLLKKQEYESQLKCQAVDAVFSIFLHSSISEVEHWDRLSKYCFNWSTQIDFLHIWGGYVNSLFKYINQIAYNSSQRQCPISGGAYTEENPVTQNTVCFLFNKILNSIDYQKTTERTELLNSLAFTIQEAKDTARAVADEKSTQMHKLRYSAAAFLKLFGRFITFTPKLGAEFDSAIRINIKTLIEILSYFELSGTDKFLDHAIAFIGTRSNEGHQQNLAAFIREGVQLFAQNPRVLPYVSQVALSKIPLFDIRVAEGNEILKPLVSLFISSSETLHGKPAVASAAFEGAWKCCGSNHYFRYVLLAYATANDMDFLGLAADYFRGDRVGELAANLPTAVSIVLLVGAAVRQDPTKIATVLESSLIPNILSSVQRPELKGHPYFEKMLIAALTMINDIIDWAPEAFHVPETNTALFEFFNFATAAVKDRESEQTGAHDRRVARVLQQNATQRVNINLPSHDHFTRRLGSSSEINEAAVVKELGIKDPIINYYTVGKDLLIAFIETPDGKGPLAFFARGSFGKAIFKVSDEYTNGQEPKPSSVVEKVDLPAAAAIENHPITMRGRQVEEINKLGQDELRASDDRLRGMYGEDYRQWLDWDKYAYYVPFGYKAPFQRPRVVDFLTTTGVLDVGNTDSVRPQNDRSAVEEAIRKFDQTETPPVVIVPIRHIMTGDEEDTVSDRMTPLMLDFLREIGQPMAAEDCPAVPTLKTTAPTVPVLGALVMFLTASMAAKEEGAKKIEEAFTSAPVSIVFNETGFELNRQYGKGQLILCVKPTLKGLYYVTVLHRPQPDGDYVYSLPFTDNMTLSASTLASYISHSIEVMLPSQYKSITPNVVKMRREIIKPLVTGEADPCLGQVASGIFASD